MNFICKMCRSAAIAVLAGAVLTGCSTVGETHYFASTDTNTGEVVNIFRVNIWGSADFSNARYLAGYYDERAVDIFFNEVNSGAYVVADHKGTTLGGTPRFWEIECATASNEAECKENTIDI